MDLISITEILWRRKIVTIPVIMLTALAVFYVVKVKPPVYQAQSSVLMVPPSPPSAAQIAANPKLAKINPSNPYTNYGDLSVVADTLIDVVTDSGSQQALAAAGADPRYQLQLSTDLGNPPIIDITGIGRTPQIAMRSAELVTAAAEADLQKLQSNEGVNSLYMVRATQLVTPSAATSSVSGKLRTLIAVLAVGILLLFVAVSLVEAVEKRRVRDRQTGPDRVGRRRPGRLRAAFLRRSGTRPEPPLDDPPTRPGLTPGEVRSRAGLVPEEARSRAGLAAGEPWAPAAPGGPAAPRIPGADPHLHPHRQPAVATPAAPRGDQQQPFRQPPPRRHAGPPSAEHGPLDRLPARPAGTPGPPSR